MAAMPAEEVKAIAQEAYTYGWPMLENFNTLFAYVLHKGGPQYKGEFNQLVSTPKCFTPADTAVVTPNSDTPYSMAWLDLRAEPRVLSVPAIEDARYYSYQFIDLYTHNFAYLGSRTTGNGGGSYLIAGPEWQGELPEGCQAAFQCETPFCMVIGRTQLFSPEDLESVQAIQAQYRCQALSEFLGDRAAPEAPPLAWPMALGVAGNKTPQAFEVLDFLLSHIAVPAHPSEEALRRRFLRLGLGSGGFKVSTLDAAAQAALAEGMEAAWSEYEEVMKATAAGKVTSGDLFGTREYLSRPGAPLAHHTARFAGAKIGLYGNSREEAIYPIYRTLDDKPLDASTESYTLRLTPEDMRMVKSFWSLTMYDGTTQLLVDNPLDRYLINSPMLGDLRREEDGSVVMHISATSPGAELESNWLPAPNGPFYMALRLYQPLRAAYEGEWKAPVLQRC